MKLTIKLENCFGISKLEKEIDFKDDKNSVLIYAPNGTMKSSFAKTMLYLSKQNISESKRPQKPCDLLDDTKIVTYEVKFDGMRLSKKPTNHFFLTISFFFQIIQQPSSIF